MLKERRKYYSKPAFLFYIQQKKKKNEWKNEYPGRHRTVRQSRKWMASHPTAKLKS
jgi:hypothetical protein